MALSETAQTDLREKLAALQAEHGSLQRVKCDDAFNAAYPDRVDLFDWRREWARAVAAEKRAAGELPPVQKPDAPADDSKPTARIKKRPTSRPTDGTPAT